MVWEKIYKQRNDALLVVASGKSMELRKAQKQQARLRLGISGPSGSGKTYSAIQLASGLTSWEKICIIDTENGSADLYSDLGAYNVLPLVAPFAPERYIEAIETAENAGMEVIIIDSITHEWSGVGGILELQEKLGGRYQDWARVKPRHRKFIDKILQSPSHVITTVRSKQDYSMDQVDGRTKVQKVGLKQVTEEGFEYELTLSFDLLLNHLAKASKDRTGMFMDQPEFTITKNTGSDLKAWADSGIAAPVTEYLSLNVFVEKLKDVNDLDALRHFYKEVEHFGLSPENVVLAQGMITTKAKHITADQALTQDDKQEVAEPTAEITQEDMDEIDKELAKPEAPAPKKRGRKPATAAA